MRTPCGMTRHFAFARAPLVVIAAGGCVSLGSPGGPTVPPSVSPVLQSWRNAGLSCGEPHLGMPEDKPQWVCQGSFRGVAASVVVMGDDAGVMDMEAQVAPDTNPTTAVGVFDDLMAATPAFPDQMPAIRQWIGDWSGASGTLSTEIQSARVTIDSNATWITLSVSRDPLTVQPSN